MRRGLKCMIGKNGSIEYVRTERRSKFDAQRKRATHSYHAEGACQEIYKRVNRADIQPFALIRRQPSGNIEVPSISRAEI